MPRLTPGDPAAPTYQVANRPIYAVLWTALVQGKVVDGTLYLGTGRIDAWHAFEVARRVVAAGDVRVSIWVHSPKDRLRRLDLKEGVAACEGATADAVRLLSSGMRKLEQYVGLRAGAAVGLGGAS